MKVVINTCAGSFGLSREATLWLRERGFGPALQHVLKGEFWHDSVVPNEVCDDDYDLDLLEDAPRGDVRVVQCVETLGDRANGMCARLKVVEIPDDVSWKIMAEDSGKEYVAEVHRTWS